MRPLRDPRPGPGPDGRTGKGRKLLCLDRRVRLAFPPPWLSPTGKGYLEALSMDQATERNFPGCGVPRTIAVTGGTHGNERGGIWTVRNLLADPARFAFPGLEVRGILSHP